MTGNKLVFINDTTDPQNNTDLKIKILRTVVITPAAAAAEIKIYDDVSAVAANLKVDAKAPANGGSVTIQMHGGVFGKGCFVVLTGAGAGVTLEQGL